MTIHAPRSRPTPPMPSRTRVKWDNVAILLVGLIAAGFAVSFILAGGTAKKSPASKAGSGSSTLTNAAADSSSDASVSMTMEDARGLVDEARGFMGEARWDEAADRLSMIPADVRDVSGATELATLLETQRAAYTSLRQELDAAVQARQWADAARIIAKLGEIATLNDEILAIQSTINAATAAPSAATTAPKPAKTTGQSTTSTTTTGSASSNAATTGGGGSKPAASSAKPAGTTIKPAHTTTKPAGSTSQPAATGAGAAASADASLGGNVSAAQQQQIQDALESALADDELNF